MSKVISCEHKIQYYETDQMKVTHHSNYIRWFEEARVIFMESFGLGYDKMESMGIISPVLEASAKYRKSTHFGEMVRVDAFIKEYNGVRLVVGYKVYETKENTLCCEGETKHCFIGEDGKIVRLAKALPAYDKMFISALNE